MAIRITLPFVSKKKKEKIEDSLAKEGTKAYPKDVSFMEIFRLKIHRGEVHPKGQVVACAFSSCFLSREVLRIAFPSLALVRELCHENASRNDENGRGRSTDRFHALRSSEKRERKARANTSSSPHRTHPTDDIHFERMQAKENKPKRKRASTGGTKAWDPRKALVCDA